MSNMDAINKALNFIKTKVNSVDMAITLGSGLGPWAERFSQKIEIPYGDIPGFPTTSVVGHAGKLVIVEMEGKKIACLQGRFHPYEGIELSDVVLPIRALGQLGAKIAILTNAAGGLNPNFQKGNIVSITDHINMMGRNPLIGENLDELGPRFPDMTQTYDRELLKLAQSQAQSLGITLREGVYVSVLGPSYETPAEVKMLRNLGADMVGMSTVPEVIAARHMGLKICAFSVITNMAAGLEGEELDHGDIKDQANRVMGDFTNLIDGLIKAV